MTEESVRRVAGFRFAGGACGLKKNGEPDLGLIVADEEVPAAAVFTRNQVKAAPVLIATERIERGRARALLVNSGNANACTGKDGIRSARATARALAEHLDIDDDAVLPASTGVIGQPLAVDRIEAGIRDLVPRLSPDAVDDFARAIMTTDRWPKVTSVQFTIGRAETATVLGIAKGAGMIHPDMATTLAFVLTDAPMSSDFLGSSLRSATNQTFNQISVDGDTSTNDAIFALTSSRADAPPIRGEERDARMFKDAMTEVLGELGKQIVLDGEGAEHAVRIEVTHAPSETAAEKVAERIACSTLVKTALHGRDPNWGRIVAAAGTAGVRFDPDKVEIRVGDVVIVKKGRSLGPAAEAEASRVMAEPEYTIRLKLGDGRAKASYLTSDLGHEYVRINADYRS